MHKTFVHERTIYFRDTDAAGVVYFANGLSLCHEAYEASLAKSGINLQSFFRGAAIAVPVTHASIDFFQPMFCGDRITIYLTPTILTPTAFQITYQIYFSVDMPVDFAIDEGSKKAIAKAVTKHTCIDSKTRKRCNLSADLLRWIDPEQS